MSGALADSKMKKRRETEDYLSKIRSFSGTGKNLLVLIFCIYGRQNFSLIMKKGSRGLVPLLAVSL